MVAFTLQPRCIRIIYHPPVVNMPGRQENYLLLLAWLLLQKSQPNSWRHQRISLFRIYQLNERWGRDDPSPTDWCHLMAHPCSIPKGDCPLSIGRTSNSLRFLGFHATESPSSNEKTWSLKTKYFAHYRVRPCKTTNKKHTASGVIWMEHLKAMSHLIVRYRPHGSQVCHFLCLLFHCRLCPPKSITHTQTETYSLCPVSLHSFIIQTQLNGARPCFSLILIH